MSEKLFSFVQQPVLDCYTKVNMYCGDH